MIRWSLIAIAILSGTPGAAQTTTDRESRTLMAQKARHADLRSDFERDIHKLAEWCNEHGMVEAAQRTLTLAAPTEPGALRDVRLPREVQPVIPPGAVDNQRVWAGRLSTIRKDYARQLYRLSRHVLDLGFPSYAMDLVREVAFHEPDNPNARRLLGYTLFKDKERSEERGYRGEWVTPYEARMRGSLKRHVWSDKFGWVPQSHLARYEQGLRPWKGTWISAEKDAQLRRSFSNAWVVETEHFKVRTNYSLERGVEIASRLEDYYKFFRNTFATFFETPAELRERFRGVTRSRRLPPPEQMEVHYFRTKDEYVSRLIRKIPQISMTEGLYYEPDKTCYFFHNPTRENDGTLFHEATHQFFDIPTAEHRMTAARLRARAAGQRQYNNWIIGEQANFWVIEGIACYMESFELTPDGFQLGNPDYIRFRAAHHRLTESDYYVPLAEFSAMGLQEFQNHPQIAQNYTQASGVAHFLMHYDDGRYRDALIDLLSQMYRPDLKNLSQTPSLAQLTGVSYEELDRQYREHILGLYANRERVSAR